MESRNFRTITTCAGIGDSIWLFMKLLSTGEKFNFHIPDGEPQRGKQIFDLVPSICSKCTYTSGISYKKVNRLNAQRKIKHFAGIGGQEFYLSANEHLEKGRRIEDFLPDLETNYRIHYDTSGDDRLRAYNLILSQEGNKIGIYCSSYATSKNWGAWQAPQWFELISLIYKHFPHNRFVIIGAEWDRDLATNLMGLLDCSRIPYINTVGQKLPVVIEILKKLNYFIGFPSGLSILNETLGKDGLMFYSPQIQGIMNTWADPVRIYNRSIKECLFDEPYKIYRWLNENNKL